MPVVQVIEIREELHVVAYLLLDRKIPSTVGRREGIRDIRLSDAGDLV